MASPGDKASGSPETEENLKIARYSAIAATNGGKLATAIDAMRKGAIYLESSPTLLSGAGTLGRAGSIATGIFKPAAYGLTAVSIVQEVRHEDYRGATTDTGALAAAVSAGAYCGTIALPTGPVGAFLASAACGGAAFWTAKKTGEKTYDVTADVVEHGISGKLSEYAGQFNQFVRGTVMTASAELLPAPHASAQSTAFTPPFKP